MFMKNKEYNTSLEFLFAIIPTIISIIITILAIVMTIKIYLSFNEPIDSKLIIIPIMIKETSRILLLTMGIISFVFLSILNLLLLKASFGVKKRKHRWGIFLIILGLLTIISGNIYVILYGALLFIAGLISVRKYIKNK